MNVKRRGERNEGAGRFKLAFGVKSYGLPDSNVLKKHELRNAGQGTCWPVGASSLACSVSGSCSSFSSFFLRNFLRDLSRNLIRNLLRCRVYYLV